MSSSGKSVYALYGLGTAAPGTAPATWEQLESMLMWRSLAYSALGGFLAGAQLDRLNVRGGKFFLGVVGGIFFPLLANGGIWIWNRK